MHIPMSEFEQTMTSCFQIFFTWDEENDKVSNILREMMKKRRDQEVIKLSQRSVMQYKHKALETRLDELRKFRQQHEQLRTVISRVIRRPGVNEKASVVPDAAGETDVNTIEQVCY